MKLVVPYTRLDPLVPKVLRDYGFSPRYAYLPEEHSYWELLCELWAEQETVVIVEQDILPWRGAIEEISECPKPWCAFSYLRHFTPEKKAATDYFGFGCVKFGQELMVKLPDAFNQMADHHWSKLDSQFEWYTYQNSVRPHHHRPSVVHAH